MEINFEEILDKHSGLHKDDDGNKCYYEWEIVKAMKEVWNLAIEKAAESAIAKGEGCSCNTRSGDLYWTFAGNIGKVIINKDSILKLKV